MSNIDTADKNFIAGSSAVAGGAIVHNAYHKGHLTGRETFYHGTRPSRVKDILETGIHASSDNSSGGVTEIVENFNNNKGGLGSGKLSFLARDKFTGRQYSYLGSHFDSGNIDNIHRFTGVHGAQARNNEANAFLADHLKKTVGIKSDKGLITASIPTWKKDSVKLVDNPEVALGKKSIAYNINPAFKAGIDNLERNSVAVEGGVSPKYLKGSKHYVKNSIGEVVDYAKHNPKRFITKGLGAGGLGVGLMAGGTALAAHTMKKEATVSNVYLEKIAKMAEEASGPSKSGMAAATVGGVVVGGTPGVMYGRASANNLEERHSHVFSGISSRYEDKYRAAANTAAQDAVHTSKNRAIDRLEIKYNDALSRIGRNAGRGILAGAVLGGTGAAYLYSKLKNRNNES